MAYRDPSVTLVIIPQMENLLTVMLKESLLYVPNLDTIFLTTTNGGNIEAQNPAVSVGTLTCLNISLKPFRKFPTLTQKLHGLINGKKQHNPPY